MSEEKKINMLIVAVILIIAGFTTATTICDAVGLIDTTGQHPAIVTLIDGAKWVALATPIVLVMGFGRGLTGYAINYLRAKQKGDAHTSYSITWLSKTLVQFEGWVVIVTPFINQIALNLPAEQKHIAMTVTAALWAFIDMIISEVKYVIRETQKEPVTPISAVPGSGG